MIPKKLISLVNKTASGDHEAFEQLLVSQNSLILWIIRRMTDCPYDAEDIRQEVSIRIFRHIASLRHPEAFGSWLRTLVIHECCRHHASRKPCVSLEAIADYESLNADRGPENAPLTHVEKLELKSSLESAVKRLPEHVRNMFYMRYCCDMGCCEIADVTGLKAGTVSVMLFRARVQLREKLNVGFADA